MPVPESAPQLPSPVDKTQALKSEPSSDDLRTGAFQYLQDAGEYRQCQRGVSALIALGMRKWSTHTDSVEVMTPARPSLKLTFSISNLI